VPIDEGILQIGLIRSNEITVYLIAWPTTVAWKRRLCNRSCLFVCLFVCQEDYCKSNQPVSLKLDVIVVLHTSQKNRSISGGDLFSLFPRIAELGILEGLLAFLIQSPAAFHEIWQNDLSQQQQNTLHLGSDPADTRNRINPEIQFKSWITVGWGFGEIIGVGGGVLSPSPSASSYTLPLV